MRLVTCPCGSPEAHRRRTEQKCTFGELNIGDHFICFPLPGDNSGHGGYRVEHFVFVKTKADVTDMYKNGVGYNVQRGIAATFPHSMPVLKVLFK